MSLETHFFSSRALLPFSSIASSSVSNDARALSASMSSVGSTCTAKIGSELASASFRSLSSTCDAILTVDGASQGMWPTQAGRRRRATQCTIPHKPMQRGYLINLLVVTEQRLECPAQIVDRSRLLRLCIESQGFRFLCCVLCFAMTNRS